MVVGGLTEAGVASDRVDVYDPATNTWDEGPRLPIGLHHVGLVGFGDRVYLAGGYHNPRPDAEWQAQSRVLSLGPGDTAVAGGSPAGRAEGRAGAGRGRGTPGGRRRHRGRRRARRTEVLVPGEAGSWRPGPDLTEPRDHLAARRRRGPGLRRRRPPGVAGEQPGHGGVVGPGRHRRMAARAPAQRHPGRDLGRVGRTAARASPAARSPRAPSPRSSACSTTAGFGWRPSRSPATAWPSSASGAGCTSSAAAPSPASS